MRGIVVLATRNHARSIGAVLAELSVAARELVADGVALEVHVVDAASADDTIDVARAASAELGLLLDVVEVEQPDPWTTQREAFEHALKTGAPDFIVTLDPSGHHDARQLPDLVRSFRSKGSGVTVGSRWIRGGSAPGTSAPRSLLSRTASLVVARATGLRRIRDVTTSFRVIRPDAARLVSERPATRGEYGFYCEFVAAAQAYGFTVDEVPIVFRPRFDQVPALESSDLTEFLGDLRRLRSRIAGIRREMVADQATWAARSGLLRGQDPTTESEFGALDELTELSGAGNFTDWIVDELAPCLPLEPNGRVLEVGAGMGAVATAIALRYPTVDVTAIEPATNVFPELQRRARSTPSLTALQHTSTDLAGRGERFESVVYVNVLEHISDDAAELHTARRLLVPGGRLGLFVPAMPSLYGSLDYKSGHYRRYTAQQLEGLLADAGYDEISVHHLDPLGVAPYWLMYRVANVGRLDRASSTGYDRVLVPMSRFLQRMFPRPPFGKNLVATARRPLERSDQG